MKNEIEGTQKNIARLYRYIREIQENILSSATNLYKEFHYYTKDKIETLSSSANKSFNKDTQNYIKNLLIKEELKLYKIKIIEKENETQKFVSALQKFIRLVFKNHPLFVNKNSEFLFQFDCPTCNNKMKIKDKVLARVKCQVCNYSFSVDTGTDVIKIFESQNNDVDQKQTNKVWTWIKLLIHKIKS